MASISSSIRMMDRLTGPVIAMANAMGHLVSVMEAADNKKIDPKGLSELKNNVAKANSEMRILQEELMKAGGKTEQNDAKQKQWNRSISQSKNNMSGIIGKLKQALGLYALISGAKKLMSLSDEVVTIDARLNLITDNATQKNNLKNAIYQSAQDARVPLNDFANSVVKLGQLAGRSFANNGEIVKFNNLMAKSFKLSGSSAQETAAAMYQLNQAMASGRLQGDEFRSIRENAPMLAQGIAKAMGVGIESLKKLGAEGKITADVIRKAVFGMENDINSSFKQLPMTWRDVWTNMLNFVIRTLNPLLNMINRIANNQKFQAIATGVANTFEIVAGVMEQFFNKALSLAGWLYDKWDALKYPIGIIIGLVAFYTVVQNLANVAIGIYQFAVGLKAAAETAASGATFMATAAQHGFNMAVYAFPGTWIVAAVLAVTAVLAAIGIAAVAAAIAFIKMKTNTLTVTGTIAGSFMWMRAVLFNVFVDIINGSVRLVNKIIGGINKLNAGVAKGLTDFANYFIDAFNWIMREADKFMNGLLKGMSAFAPMLKAVGLNLPTSTGGAIHLNRVNLTAKQIPIINGGNNELLKKKDPKYEFEAAAAWGNRTERNAIDKLKGVKDKFDNLFDPDNLGGGKDYDPAAGKNTENNTGKTAKNTGKMADKLDDTEEDMKYLRELAEQEHINQFTTAEIKVDMNNNNTIEKDADINDIVRKLKEQIEEEMARTAERKFN